MRRRTAVLALGAVIAVATVTAAPRVGGHVGAANPCPTVQGPVGDSFVDCAQGSVFNIVPPGQTGTYNLADFVKAEAGQGTPPNTDDQEGMYSNLAKVAPNLTIDQISQYYKDASFFTDARTAMRVETFPTHPGTTILRDSFDVPHIYGVTRADTEFGAGYASAEDRLFEMDALRHVGRGTLTSFIGPSPGNEAMDCSVAEAAGYSETELQQQVDDFASQHSDPFSFVENGQTVNTTEGAQIVNDANAWVNGVNEYIAEAHVDNRKLPAEYPALQIPLLPWKATDIVATATLVQAIFATGGGNEVGSALLYQSLINRYGQAQGSAIWSDLRSQNDPDVVTSIPTPFSYEQVPASVDANSLAMPVQPPADNHCSATPPSSVPGQVSTAGVTVDLTPLFSAIRSGIPHASNELIVDAAHSANGHPIAVFGPQTGYYVPQLLHEIDLHGPGLHARGVSFAGTEIFVELGRGVDYAWSATSAGADIIDQRLEKLCNVDGTPATLSSTAYIYNGTCTPMYERTDTQIAKTSAAATNPPQTFTIQIERTVHGPVVGRTMANDPATGTAIPAAVSVERSTWGDELGSAPAFLEWNDPDVIHSATDFQRAAGKETGTFNWTYVDSHDVAYYMSGELPVRAANANPNFPVWGTGQWDWQGFHTVAGQQPPAFDTVPTDLSAADVHPRASTIPASVSGTVNGTFADGFFTNWNNKGAPGFSAADSNFAYGPVYRVQSLADRVRAAIAKGGGKANPVDIVNAMEDGGTVDLDAAQLVNQVASVLGTATLTPAEQQVLGILQSWVNGDAAVWGSGVPGGHRRDPNLTWSPSWTSSSPGGYDQGDAVAIMDELYPRLTHAVFDPWLDSSQYGMLAGLNPINDKPRAQGSAYDGGWEGYLQRSLQQALGQAAHPYSQSYCGGGSLSTCQSALLSAIDGTISQLSSLYGSSDPTAWTCSRSNPLNGHSPGEGQQSGTECNPALDDIPYNAVGVGVVPNMPWVNRPTFQQFVSYQAGRS